MSSFTINLDGLGTAVANFNYVQDRSFDFNDVMLLELSKAIIDMFGLTLIKPEIAFDSFTQELVLATVRLGLRFNILNIGTRLNDYTLGYYIIIATDQAMLNIVDSRLVEASQEGITDVHYFDVFPNTTYYVAAMYNGVFFDVTEIETLAAKVVQLTIVPAANSDSFTAYLSRNGNQILYFSTTQSSASIVDAFKESELTSFTITFPPYLNRRRSVTLRAYYDSGSTVVMNDVDILTTSYTTSLMSVLSQATSFLRLEIFNDLW